MLRLGSDENWDAGDGEGGLTIILTQILIITLVLTIALTLTQMLAITLTGLYLDSFAHCHLARLVILLGLGFGFRFGLWRRLEG